MNYINTDKHNRISTMRTKTVMKRTTSLSKIHKKLVDAQTHKWTRPPQMSTENKTHKWAGSWKNYEFWRYSYNIMNFSAKFHSKI